MRRFLPELVSGKPRGTVKSSGHSDAAGKRLIYPDSAGIHLAVDAGVSG